LLLDLRLSGSNRRFKFDKRRYLLIRTHNEALTVVAMCVSIVRPPESRFAA
jgi:hypothetical protein